MRHSRIPAVLIASLFAVYAVADEKPAKVSPEHAARIKQGLALFQSDVRGVLVTHCLDCHGGKSVKADFDLSTRQRLMKSGFVDKTSADSHLMALLTHAEEPHMPFKKPKLPTKTIAAIAKWIDLGAPYDKPLVDGRDPAVRHEITDADRAFWSFLPLSKTNPPKVGDHQWCRTSIDHFVRAKQEAAGLKPNGVIENRKLIRRVYFDLIGLPPSPAEMETWLKRLNAKSPVDMDAYGQLIDSLLASKHYGERWARHWLDVARFAESHGYEQDYDRPHAYHYRDFLIKAFNQDMPFDQMISWQLAGDELAPDNSLAMMATGFLGAGVFPTQLTEREFESARYDELDDMLGTTGVAFLGLSIGCARCHDHKYDPISTRDYYRMASTFTTTIRSEIDVAIDDEETRRSRAEHAKKVAELSAELEQYKKTLKPKFLKWLATSDLSSDVDPWSTLRIESVTSTGGTKFNIEPDQTVMAASAVPNKEVIEVIATTTRTSLATVRLETLTHDSFPRRGPGRAANGNFALGDFRVEVSPLNDDPAKFAPIKFTTARATHQQNTTTLSVAASIDDDPVSGWAVDVGGIGKDQAAVFDADKSHASKTGLRVKIRLTLNHPNNKHTLGRFRLSVAQETGLRPKVGQDGLDQETRNLLASLKANLKAQTSDDLQRGIDWFAPRDPEWSRLSNELAKLKSTDAPVAKVKVQVTSEGYPHMKHHADGRGYPHFYKETHLLNRGDVNQKLEPVSQSFLRVLMPATKKESSWIISPPKTRHPTSYRRASLANWLTDVKDGAGALAARVAVNRVWQHHFGRGIVATPNDFGFQGERPTHPELLDWLAGDFVKNSWQVKRLHKLIMTSSVYMQSGESDYARAKIDRENNLLWRRAPRRLEAEAIRDSMLAVSGQLDRAMYGKGTLDQNTKRRSVYFFIKRSKLIPMMMLFDWPEHLVSIGARSTTTIAPQALAFMNSPQGRAYADAFARAANPENSSIETIVRNAYGLAFARQPTSREQSIAVQFLKSQQAEYEPMHGANARHVAVTDFCQAVFGMNEFVYVD